MAYLKGLPADYLRYLYSSGYGDPTGPFRDRRDQGYSFGDMPLSQKYQPPISRPDDLPPEDFNVLGEIKGKEGPGTSVQTSRVWTPKGISISPRTSVSADIGSSKVIKTPEVLGIPQRYITEFGLGDQVERVKEASLEIRSTFFPDGVPPFIARVISPESVTAKISGVKNSQRDVTGREMSQVNRDRSLEASAQIGRGLFGDPNTAPFVRAKYGEGKEQATRGEGKERATLDKVIAAQITGIPFLGGEVGGGFNRRILDERPDETELTAEARVPFGPGELNAAIDKTIIKGGDNSAMLSGGYDSELLNLGYRRNQVGGSGSQQEINAGVKYTPPLLSGVDLEAQVSRGINSGSPNTTDLKVTANRKVWNGILSLYGGLSHANDVPNVLSFGGRFEAPL